MTLPVRTTLAVLAVVLASAAQAAPLPSLSNQPNLVVSVADDSTSENDAIAIERNLPPAVPPAKGEVAAPEATSSGSSADNEKRIEDREPTHSEKSQY